MVIWKELCSEISVCSRLIYNMPYNYCKVLYVRMLTILKFSPFTLPKKFFWCIFFTQSSVFASLPIVNLLHRLFPRFIQRSEVPGTKVVIQEGEKVG